MRIVNFKRPHPNTGVVYRNDVDGVYDIPCRGVLLLVIASNGHDWEHVSVSESRRCPTWSEMEFIRECFWRDDETVMQLSVPRAEHVNNHPYCLHLWRPLTVDIPRPPRLMVGV